MYGHIGQEFHFLISPLLAVMLLQLLQITILYVKYYHIEKKLGLKINNCPFLENDTIS